MTAAPSPSPARANRRPGGVALEPWRAAIKGRDLYPTPPWATRALLAHVLPTIGVDTLGATVWEPCAGLGHMADVLRETAPRVVETDAYDYGRLSCAQWDARCGTVPDSIASRLDWIITNPPFGLADTVFRVGLRARVGVAMLLPLRWLNGQARFSTLLRETPPTIVAPFSERVGMVEGGFDPAAKTADAHAWFVWRRSGPVVQGPHEAFACRIIPPCKAELSRSADWLFARRSVDGWAPPRLTKLSTPQSARAMWQDELRLRQAKAAVDG